MAVIAKVDCRVFCHINSLGDKISNTAAQIQPNSFWFWEKSLYIKIRIEYEIFGEWSHISTNQKREKCAFSLLIGSNL